ncbi:MULTISPECIES: RNA-binding S4 domain-containing protein [unclassified Chelatococcus]|uniref:RNA-binding S4 domain-containing protein n=1 Tax=unclassified Chelatococcus TaxID=2638111 RepID=UPI00224BBF9C|nr:RNA-binding S4 domain-containing protein [Chelatococcus sp.]CAH1656157.1 Heat shock protein Hsp15 [Hyphomicrobiales bacterium]CAH1684838.1 Heat shock protein Hsp15 [Hyphomicrobiales bacterium]
MKPASGERIRIDKWLWHARMAKSRTLAGKLVESGHVRLNGRRLDGADRLIKPGDILTLALAHATLVVEVLALGQRRGPASEARTLYRDQVGGTATAADLDADMDD